MASDPVPGEPDPRLHRPRIVTLAALVGTLLTGLAMPAIGLHRESDPDRTLLAPVDAARAGREAAEVQRLALSALTEVREAVHGCRTVDLRDQLTATAQVLRSSGVRCTVDQPDEEVPLEAASQLVPVLREASTNLLRHSRANWCRIELRRDGGRIRMTVSNDGVGPAEPDRHSFGLRGLAERLTDADGTLRTTHDDGVFTVEATVPTAR
ncbi:hypothetical protein I0C86_42120 [Plantactinospora sp. S1510]|uniref:Histidine kinase/HSP90-like ATPase domain-containing protein n=1 Tax=Plantactinospora alkalitolerans TaxID=2789879 RepID=A0ABS0HAF5_9ACTN|nr:ATP-binding protein [Plantactinospora alkalitolerans]MBF9135452.1 hypothetical protein [Plantactinospora alkalitolerans]